MSHGADSLLAFQDAINGILGASQALEKHGNRLRELKTTDSELLWADVDNDPEETTTLPQGLRWENHWETSWRELLGLIEAELPHFWLDYDSFHRLYHALDGSCREWLGQHHPRWWPELSDAVSIIEERYHYTRRRDPQGEQYYDPSVLRHCGQWTEAENVLAVLNKSLRNLDTCRVDTAAIQAEPMPAAATSPTAAVVAETETNVDASHGKGDANAASNEVVMARVLSIFTRGVSDEKMQQVPGIINSQLTVNQKIEKINKLIPFSADTPAEQIGKLIGVSKQAVANTQWWKDHRKGAKQQITERRVVLQRERAAASGNSNRSGRRVEHRQFQDLDGE